ncbi:MAG: hypothetical protein WC415_00760 [Patescibacteria group bacterium]|jgi:hypothetical protein
MDIPFISKPKEEDSVADDKKIEFAKKLGEDLTKKESLPSFLNEKKVEDIYDVKDVKAAGVVKKEDLLAEEVLEEPLPIKESFFSDFLEKFKNNFFKPKKELEEGVLEVNLVKEEIVKYFDWQRGILVILLAAFFSLSLLSAGYWVISWLAEKRQVASNSSYTQSYFKINKEIKELSPQVAEVLAFKSRMDLSNTLLDSHIYWTNFFDFLESNTLSDVYFSSFSGDISGDYQFSATSNSVDAINVQIKKLLSNTYIKNARVDSTSVALDKDGLAKTSFQLVFLLDPQIFLKKSESELNK